MSYENEIKSWRAAYERNLQAQNSWLSITGLHWLEEGDNVLPATDCSGLNASPGTVTLEGDQLSFQPSDEALAAHPELAGHAGPLELDGSGNSQRVTYGRCSFVAIQRLDRFAVRTFDLDSELRRNFRGAAWYPINEKWRLQGEYHPYSEPRQMPMTNIVGQVRDVPVPGELVFTIGDEEYRLLPTKSGDNFFVVFRDETAGSETYGAARFLSVKAPDEEGRVTVDFNRAYHPPCFYTPHATCPLPFRENVLPLRIRAGECLPD